MTTGAQQVGATIIDVIENFCAAHAIEDFDTVAGTTIVAFGEEVQRFAASYQPPTTEDSQHPLYIGGWPSANFYHAAHGSLLSSALLYCGQVLVKDPLIDWFSVERYSYQQLMSAREGFLVPGTSSYNIAGTRRFLAVVVPALLALKPLIESRALVLVAGDANILENETVSQDLAEKLSGIDEVMPVRVAQLFAPEELAVDDRRRGMFTFAGGERESQIAQSVGYAYQYFAREYILATTHDVDYAAPWRFEQYLCENGLLAPTLRSETQRVVRALWSSAVPLFQGLTPRILADVRQDDAFASFRSALFDAYRGLPADADEREFDQYVREAEGARLTPLLQEAARAADRGWLAKLGVEVVTLGANLSAAVLVDVSKGEVDASTPLQGLAGYLVNKVRPGGGSGGAVSIFTKLTRHQRKLEQEVRTIQNVDEQSNQSVYVASGTTSGWNIADKPSMNITISRGAFLIETATVPGDDEGTDGSAKQRNRPCNCGSGIKWKHCCRDVSENWQPISPEQETTAAETHYFGD